MIYDETITFETETESKLGAGNGLVYFVLAQLYQYTTHR